MPRKRFIEVATYRRLRQGENPLNAHPRLAVRFPEKRDPLALHRFEQMLGRDPGFVNMTSLDCLVDTITRIGAGYAVNFGRNPRRLIVVIAKHGIPCGAAVRMLPKGASLADATRARVAAIEAAVAGDARAAFGGEVIVNFPLEEPEARALRNAGLLPYESARPYDLVAAPSFDSGAVDALARKNGHCVLFANPALLTLGKNSMSEGYRVRGVRGGMLEEIVHTIPPFVADDGGQIYRIFGNQTPNRKEDYLRKHQANLVLAWAICSSSPGNAISIVYDQTLWANAAGDQRRDGAARRAARIADRVGYHPLGKAAYSNGFFGFPDAVRELVNGGVEAIMVPGGSVNDEKIGIEFQDRVTMLFLPKEWRGFSRH